MLLARNLDLSAAAPLWSSLTKARGGALELDASQVERLSGVCLQVLLAAAAAWRAAGLDFRIVESSQAFSDAVEIMGAGEQLGVRQAG